MAASGSFYCCHFVSCLKLEFQARYKRASSSISFQRCLCNGRFIRQGTFKFFFFFFFLSLVMASLDAIVSNLFFFTVLGKNSAGKRSSLILLPLGNNCEPQIAVNVSNETSSQQGITTQRWRGTETKAARGQRRFQQICTSNRTSRYEYNESMTPVEG